MNKDASVGENLNAMVVFVDDYDSVVLVSRQPCR